MLVWTAACIWNGTAWRCCRRRSSSCCCCCECCCCKLQRGAVPCGSSLQRGSSLAPRLPEKALLTQLLLLSPLLLLLQRPRRARRASRGRAARGSGGQRRRNRSPGRRQGALGMLCLLRLLCLLCPLRLACPQALRLLCALSEGQRRDAPRYPPSARATGHRRSPQRLHWAAC